jgi:hypothetical protein
MAVDNRDRDGIIVAAAPTPPEARWLAEQRDPQLREHVEALWWTLLPLSGGAVMVPQPLLRLLGRPSGLQHAIVWRNANAHGRRHLETLLGAPPF